jgi:cardiolipin synthase
MLIDGRWSVIGSANLDQRSFHRNFEVNVIVSSSDFGKQVAEMFSEDLALSRRISLEEHEKRGIIVRVMEKLISLLNWFL